jgi:hypothetical protein
MWFGRQRKGRFDSAVAASVPSSRTATSASDGMPASPHCTVAVLVIDETQCRFGHRRVCQWCQRRQRHRRVRVSGVSVDLDTDESVSGVSADKDTDASESVVSA